MKHLKQAVYSVSILLAFCGLAYWWDAIVDNTLGVKTDELAIALGVALPVLHIWLLYHALTSFTAAMKRDD